MPVRACPPWPWSLGSSFLVATCRTTTGLSNADSTRPARPNRHRRPGVSNRSMKAEGEAVWVRSSTRHHPEYDSGGGSGPFFHDRAPVAILSVPGR